MRTQSGMLGTVTGFGGFSDRTYLQLDDGSTFACYASDLERVVDRTEPHDDRDGLSASDILEKVAERLDRRGPCGASTDTLRIVSRELKALAEELRR